MVRGTSDTIASEFDFKIAKVSKGTVTLPASLNAKMVYLGTYTGKGVSQTLRFVPSAAQGAGIFYLILVPRSAGISRDVMDSNTGYRIAQLALSDLKLAYEVDSEW